MPDRGFAHNCVDLRSRVPFDIFAVHLADEVADLEAVCLGNAAGTYFVHRWVSFVQRLFSSRNRVLGAETKMCMLSSISVNGKLYVYVLKI